MSKKENRGATPPLWVSQNFLTRRALIERLVSRAGLSAQDHILEIGPGKGHITAALLRRCAQVTAVEIDPRLCAHLRDRFSGEDRLTLIQRDFLRWPLPARGAYKVFSNIPFSLTTQIMRRLTESPNPPAEAFLIMEKGAAMRFMGKPSASLRSLALQPYYHMRILHRFEREDFHPRPSVDVVMLHLQRRNTPDVNRNEQCAYQRFLRTAFDRGLRAALGPGCAKMLRRAGVCPGSTPGDISYVQWLCLFRCGKRG